MNNVLKTSADDFYELVKSRKKISIADAAKILKMPVNVVHALADFLVEEKIFGIEYKFTTPYIYISHEPRKEKSQEASFTKSLITKEEFFEKAKNRGIPFEKISELWRKYIEENIKSIREEFYAKAKSRNMGKEQADALWDKYLTYLR